MCPDKIGDVIGDEIGADSGRAIWNPLRAIYGFCTVGNETGQQRSEWLI
jgi:hypothetical protein